MASKKKRDDFSTKTKTILRDRAGHKCSNPACEAYTSGPGNGFSETMHLGDAAHICAASQNGPRYDEKMTSTERSSIENGIWLCTICARKIDRNDDIYSVSLLKEWKTKAEERARRDNGEKSYSKDKIISDVAAIITGTPTLAPHIIGNSHTAVTKALQQLDPRFEVTSHFDGKKTEFFLNAKENFKVDFSINTESVESFEDKYKRLIDNGDPLSIPAEHIKVSGSKLVEFAINDQPGGGSGTLILSPPKHPGTLRIHTTDKNNNPKLELDDIQGNYQAGSKQVQFNGSLFNGLININLRAKITGNNGKSRIDTVTITPETPLTPWENKNVLSLIYFDELKSFCKSVKESEFIVFRFRFQGKDIVFSKTKCENLSPFIDNLLTLHSYISLTRRFSEITATPVNFRSSVITVEDWRELRKYIQFGSSETNHNASALKEPHIELEFYKPPEENKRIDLLGRKDENFRLVEAESQSINIFNQLVRLPRRSFNYYHVNVESIEDHEDTVLLKLVPNDNFYLNVTYLDD